MRLGVSSYSYSSAVKAGAIGFTDIPRLAREAGFDELEFSAFMLSDGETTAGMAETLRAECERVGMPVGNYTIAGDFLTGSDGDHEAEIERLKREVDVAVILGSPRMRHDATRGLPADAPTYVGFDDVLPRLAQGCRAVTEYAETHGVQTMMENHGFFAQDSDRVEKLVRTVAHPNFGLLLDIGNFLCADESPEAAIGKLARYAFHVHAKDFHTKAGHVIDPGEGWFLSRGGNYLRGAIAGHGDVGLFQCLRQLARSGYDETVSLEFEGLEDPVRALAIGSANVRRYLAML